MGDTGTETFEAINTLLGAPTPPPANGAVYPTATVGNALRQAAGLVKVGIMGRAASSSTSGAASTATPASSPRTSRTTRRSEQLAAFVTDLGSLIDSVAVMVVTEFGRTAAQNGTLGTDHGSGHCALLLGGRVRGGRVLGRWPGLGRGQLHEERDLAATTDYRDLFAEVARVQLGVAENLFPGYTPGPGPGALA